MERITRDRRYRRKNDRKKLFIRIASIISVLIVAVCSVRWVIEVKKAEERFYVNGNEFMDGYYTQNAGIIESILNEDESIVYSIHYPKFSQKEIDADIKSLINKTMKKAKKKVSSIEVSSEEERSMLYINYDSYMVGENIASVLFYIELNALDLANPELVIVSKHYDIDRGEILSNDDLFKGEYIEAIANYCKQYLSEQEEYKDFIQDDILSISLDPTHENYSNLSLTSNGVLVTFSKNQIFSGLKEFQIEIPYDLMKEYLQFDYTKNKIVIEKEIINEIPEKETPIIDPEKPMIALTFDDGPNPSSTNRILDVLAQYNSRATFFVVGNRLNNYPETLQRIISENSEIGSHTNNHKSLSLLSKKEIQRELSVVDDTLKEIVGEGAATLRPPYGAVNDEVRETVDKPMICWSVDTEDWKSRNTKKIVNHVLENVKDGDIILFHDLYDTTAAAIEELVPELTKQGYQIVTVSEMFKAKNIALEPGKVYYSAR